MAVAGLYLGDIAKTYLPAELFSNYSAAVETLTNFPQGQVDLQLRQNIIFDSAVFSSSDFRDIGTYSAVMLGLDPPVDPTYSDLFVQSYMTADLLADPYGNPVDGNPNLFFLNLQPDSLTIALVSSVPETSTRAMLIIGLGAIGAAIRRRGFARYRDMIAV